METIYTQNNESSDMDLKKIKEQKKKEKQAIKLVQKAKKKLVQMTTTLPNLENKSLEQLFTTTPTANVLLAHFGTGSQQEKTTIINLLSDLKIDTSEYHLNIYPGFYHGHISFSSVSMATQFVSLFDHLVEHNGLALNCTEIVLQSGSDKTRVMMVGFTDVLEQDMSYHKEFPFDESHSLENLDSQLLIEGLNIENDFISKKESYEILREIDSNQKWDKVSNNRVQNFGYEYFFGKNLINRESQPEPLPDFFIKNEKIKNLIDTYKYNNIFIYELKMGQGLPPNVFTHSSYGSDISIITLNAGIATTFLSQKGVKTELYTQRNSLLTLSDLARYAYYRAVPIRKVDIYNKEICFRDRTVFAIFTRVRGIDEGPCECVHETLCDSRGYNSVLINIPNLVTEENNKKDTKVIYNDPAEQELINEAKLSEEKHKPTGMEKKYVYEVYEKIADHFSDTRYKPWPQVEHFLKTLPKHSVVCDVGCGNGKYLGINPDVVMIGTDITHNLLKICVERGQSVFRADSLVLPVKTSSIDFCISIAVIHHFSNSALRKKALEELLRIVKPGGQVLVTVWALEQNKKFKTADVFLPWNLQKTYHANNESVGLEKNVDEIIHAKATDDQRPEVFRDDKKKAVVYKRYYHLFVFKELEGLLEEIGGLKIVHSFYDRDNWCVIFEKLVI